MAQPFKVRELFSLQQCEQMLNAFNFSRATAIELQQMIQEAFRDYIILALSEELSDSREDRNRTYIEAAWHLEKAEKLLKDAPHPGNNIASKLERFIKTLRTISESQEGDSQMRATRFMEKNLARNLRNVWENASTQAFLTDKAEHTNNMTHFISQCLFAAKAAYPEISWFQGLNKKTITVLVRSLR